MDWREKPGPVRPAEDLFDAGPVDGIMTTMAESLAIMEELPSDHPLREAHSELLDTVIEGDVLVYDSMAASDSHDVMALGQVLNERSLRPLLTSPFQVIKGARKFINFRRDPAVRAFGARSVEDVVFIHNQNLIKLEIVRHFGEYILHLRSWEEVREDALGALDRLTREIDERNFTAFKHKLGGSAAHTRGRQYFVVGNFIGELTASIREYEASR